MRIRHYIGRRYSHGFDPSFRKPLIAHDIALRMVMALVYLTINFNDKLGFCTVKIRDKRPYRMLFAERETFTRMPLQS